MKPLFFSILLITLASCAKEGPEIPAITACNAGKLQSYDQSNSRFEYDYDEQGRILQVRQTDRDDRVQFIDFQFDDEEKTALAVSSGFRGNDTTHFIFDEAWRLIEIRDENRSFFTYDATGHLTGAETFTYEDDTIRFHFQYNYIWEDGNLTEITRKNVITGDEGWAQIYRYSQEPNSFGLPLVRIFTPHWYDFHNHFLPPVKNLVTERGIFPVQYHYRFDASGGAVHLLWELPEGSPGSDFLFTFYCE